MEDHLTFGIVNNLKVINFTRNAPVEIKFQLFSQIRFPINIYSNFKLAVWQLCIDTIMYLWVEVWLLLRVIYIAFDHKTFGIYSKWKCTYIYVCMYTHVFAYVCRYIDRHTYKCDPRLFDMKLIFNFCCSIYFGSKTESYLIPSPVQTIQHHPSHATLWTLPT